MRAEPALGSRRGLLPVGVFAENVKENIVILLFCSKGNAQHPAPTGLALSHFGQSHRGA